MFKKKKKDNTEEIEAVAVAETPVEETPAVEPAPAAKPLPPLPACDNLVAGVIAIVFAAVGMMMCMNVVKEANPKEKKPKKPKKEKKQKEDKAE